MDPIAICRTFPAAAAKCTLFSLASQIFPRKEHMNAKRHVSTRFLKVKLQ
jgi:hypothetical protein